MRLKHSRLSGPRQPWSYPVLSLTWLLAVFFLVCQASELILTRAMPGATSHWLALSPEGIREGSEWQFLSHALVNSSIGEVLVGVLFFFLLGSELETLLGPRRLIAAFGFTLLPSGAASLLWSPEGGQMGFWPGICGLLAVLATMLPLLEFRYRFFRYSVLVRLRVLVCLGPAALACAILAGWVTHTSLLSLPPALLLGYVYARWIGYGVPTRVESYFYERRLQRQRWARLDARTFIEQEVDPILEKIARSGRKSLSRHERKILNLSADRLKNS